MAKDQPDSLCKIINHQYRKIENENSSPASVTNYSAYLNLYAVFDNVSNIGLIKTRNELLIYFFLAFTLVLSCTCSRTFVTLV